MGEQVSLHHTRPVCRAADDDFAHPNAVLFVSDQDAQTPEAEHVITEHFRFCCGQVNRNTVEQPHVALEDKGFALGLGDAPDAFAGGQHVHGDEGRVQAPFEIIVAHGLVEGRFAPRAFNHGLTIG